MGEKVFMQGNQAMAESAIRAGCKLFFGYPITPSSEVPEYYANVMETRPEEGVMSTPETLPCSADDRLVLAACVNSSPLTSCTA